MPVAFSQGYAVVIGVGADLPVTVADAEAVANQLTNANRCGYQADHVRLLTEQAAQKDAILAALDWLAASSGPEATALVYFSGHGVELPAYHLLPWGYDLSNLAGTTIAGTLFTERLRRVQAGKLVVLLDCCHAGGQAEAKGQLWIKSPLPPNIGAELRRSSGRVVVASSRKNEVSWTGKPVSVFTGAVLEALSGAGAFEQDGYARILDLALWVGRRVPEDTQDKQHPIIKVNRLEDNFALAWYAGGAKQPPTDGAAIKPDIGQPKPSTAQSTAWRRMLANKRENLLLIEERMSEYIEYTEIPLQLVKDKRRTETEIADLEQKLEIRS